jgi:MFS family permease
MIQPPTAVGFIEVAAPIPPGERRPIRIMLSHDINQPTVDKAAVRSPFGWACEVSLPILRGVPHVLIGGRDVQIGQQHHITEVVDLRGHDMAQKLEPGQLEPVCVGTDLSPVRRVDRVHAHAVDGGRHQPRLVKRRHRAGHATLHIRHGQSGGEGYSPISGTAMHRHLIAQRSESLPGKGPVLTHNFLQRNHVGLRGRQPGEDSPLMGPDRVDVPGRKQHSTSMPRPCMRLPSLAVSERRFILTFGLLTGLLASGYGVMFTVLDDYRRLYHIHSSALGLVVAVGFFSSFAAQVLLAPIADRGHARSLIIIGIAATVVGLLGMAFSTHLFGLLMSRLLMGIGAGMAVPAVRRIVILAAPDEIGRNMGMLLSTDVGGFAAGPAVSAVLVGPFGLKAPFLVIAALTLGCLPIILRLHVQESAEPPKERFAFDLLKLRPFVAAVALGCAVFVMIGTFDALWVLVLDDLRASDWIKNLGITLFALPLVVLGSIGGRFCQKFGPFRIGTFGLLAGACFMFLYGRMPTGAAMMAVGMVHSLNDGFTVTSTGVAVGMNVDPERQAGAQGLLGGAQTLVAGITAIAAGQVYEHLGRAAAYTMCTAVMAGLVAVGAAFAITGKVWNSKA